MEESETERELNSTEWNRTERNGRTRKGTARSRRAVGGTRDHRAPIPERCGLARSHSTSLGAVTDLCRASHSSAV